MMFIYFAPHKKMLSQTTNENSQNHHQITSSFHMMQQKAINQYLHAPPINTFDYCEAAIINICGHSRKSKVRSTAAGGEDNIAIWLLWVCGIWFKTFLECWKDLRKIIKQTFSRTNIFFLRIKTNIKRLLQLAHRVGKIIYDRMQT